MADSHSPSSSTPSNADHIVKIQSLLRAKDDTKRFVGLALLKSVLDDPACQQDVQTVESLWASLSPVFLDRLLRTGSRASSKNAKEMLDLAVSVLHTFAVLLPDSFKSDVEFLHRIPALVNAVLYRYTPSPIRLDHSSNSVISSKETTDLILQLLHTLVSSQAGAIALVKVDDLSSLTEMAASHASVLDILSFAWLSAMTATEDLSALATQVDSNMQSLVSSFTGTDAVTLLEFLGYFLRNANSTVSPPESRYGNQLTKCQIIPSQPKWLQTVVNYIHNLVASRPTPEARSAYTNAAAALLQTYPDDASKLLFTHSKKDEQVLSYLLINLLLIDIRSSIPTLLEKLNAPEYPQVSRRLASAFDVVTIFIGHLIRSLEVESLEASVMPPDQLLKLRKAIDEAMSAAAEHLRDRWDASVAGAMGLHRDARAGLAETSTGKHRTLAWDFKGHRIDEDPFVLAAVRALAIWLRENENDNLREEAAGLMDMFVDLYCAGDGRALDFRSPVLAALEGLVALDSGREIFLAHDGWQLLSHDLASIFQHGNSHGNSLGFEADCARAMDIVRVLLAVVEEEINGIPEAWMDLITAVAGSDLSSSSSSAAATTADEHMQEAQLAALQLACAVLVGTNSGTRQRYRHSVAAINGLAAQLARRVDAAGPLAESLEDVLETLRTVTAA